jgi:hypothetical protein
VVRQVTLGRVFLSTSVLPCQYSTNSPYSSLSTCCPYEKGEQAKPGNRPGSVVCRVSVALTCFRASSLIPFRAAVPNVVGAPASNAT